MIIIYFFSQLLMLYIFSSDVLHMATYFNWIHSNPSTLNPSWRLCLTLFPSRLYLFPFPLLFLLQKQRTPFYLLLLSYFLTFCYGSDFHMASFIYMREVKNLRLYAFLSYVSWCLSGNRNYRYFLVYYFIIHFLNSSNLISNL